MRRSAPSWRPARRREKVLSGAFDFEVVGPDHAWAVIERHTNHPVLRVGQRRPNYDESPVLPTCRGGQTVAEIRVAA
jgi:hypothetical protein